VTRRPYCLIYIAVIIMLGLLSRKVAVIPVWVGDALYATMIFYIVRGLFPEKGILWIAAAELCICFTIECSQLYQASWINNIRSTLPGRLILGQGFLWTDLIAYIAGTFAGFIIEWRRKP